MKPKHSPAPWMNFDNGNIRDASGKIIAKLPFNDQMRDEEQIANIGLVIAAPQLLAALEGLVLELSAPRPCPDVLRDVFLPEARRAIAQAKGEA